MGDVEDATTSGEMKELRLELALETYNPSPALDTPTPEFYDAPTPGFDGSVRSEDTPATTATGSTPTLATEATRPPQEATEGPALQALRKFQAQQLKNEEEGRKGGGEPTAALGTQARKTGRVRRATEKARDVNEPTPEPALRTRTSSTKSATPQLLQRDGDRDRIYIPAESPHNTWGRPVTLKLFRRESLQPASSSEKKGRERKDEKRDGGREEKRITKTLKVEGRFYSPDLSIQPTFTPAQRKGVGAAFPSREVKERERERAEPEKEIDVAAIALAELTMRSSTIVQPLSAEPATVNLERNIEQVVLGDVMFKTWYPSWYPKEVLSEKGKVPTLYVCKWCFGYGKDVEEWVRHCKGCLRMGQVPGREVYRHGGGGFGVWEVDGASDTLFCQNLSLFAKLFLDNKSVLFDVTSFNYFLLVFTHATTNARQVIGFFSKEKMSWDSNNLACILVFPPWQRKGLGRLLMGVSYEISRREGILGGPEKPISELGRRGYLRFWGAEVARFLLAEKEPTVKVESISRYTWIMAEDCLVVLREMGVEDVEDGKVRLDKEVVRSWCEKKGISLRKVVDGEGFIEGYGFKAGEDEENGVED